MISVRVSGTEDIAKVVKGLRQAGEQGKGLRKDMRKAINRSTKPLKQEAKQSAKQVLPKSGGLNRVVARSSFSTKMKLSGATQQVSIIAKKNGTAQYINRINAGRVRHPLFGNRRYWYSQSVTPGWFDKPMKKGAGRVRKDILRVVDDTARKLNRL